MEYNARKKKEQEEGHIQEMHALICLAAKITALTRNTTIQRLRYEGGGRSSPLLLFNTVKVRFNEVF